MGVATKRDRAEIEARCQKELDDVLLSSIQN